MSTRKNKVLAGMAQEDFTRLVAYWKAQSDLGLLDVVTPSQFDALMRGR